MFLEAVFVLSSVLLAILQSLRPHQWIKNLFVAAPLLFSKHLFHAQSIGVTLFVFLLFSTLSGAVYLVNDIFDLEKDRAHPLKSKRPIPSGRLPIGMAQLSAAILILAGLAASLLINVPFFACTAGYLLLNFSYSLALKRVPFVDVLCIAGGFLLRVEGGAIAISVPVTPWLMACTFLLACFLGFGKRYHELNTSGNKAVRQRTVLAYYNTTSLKWVLYGLAVATSAVYVLYTVSLHAQHYFGNAHLVYTSVFAMFGVIRFVFLVSKKTSAESPTDAMLRDSPFIINLMLWLGATIVIIYSP